MMRYKYVAARKDILQNGTIRFSQNNVLNDPFELSPSLDAYKKMIRKECEKIFSINLEFQKLPRFAQNTQIFKTINPIYQQMENLLGSRLLILSLTKKRNNLLMWSHYTNTYQGYVIGFDGNHEFFHTKTDVFSKAMDVRYSKERPDMTKVSTPFSSEINIEEAFNVLLTKSDHWSYEEEVRMFAIPQKEHCVGFDNNNQPLFLFKFPPEIIKEIILGYRLSNRLKKEIAEIVREKYPSANIFEAVPDLKVFDLQIVSYK